MSVEVATNLVGEVVQVLLSYEGKLQLVATGRVRAVTGLRDGAMLLWLHIEVDQDRFGWGHRHYVADLQIGDVIAVPTDMGHGHNVIRIIKPPTGDSGHDRQRIQ